MLPLVHMQRFVSQIAVGLIVLVLANTIKGTELTDIWALGRAGVHADEQKDYTNARRQYDAAVQLHPKNPVAYAHRGLFFLKHHEYALAAKDFDTALSLHRTVLEYAEWRGMAYARLGRYDFALADFNQLLSLHTVEKGDWVRGEILNERAWILATCPDARYRNGKQAVEDATSAVRIGGYRKAGCLDTLAAAYAETGDFESAIKYEQQAIAAQTKFDKLSDAEGALNTYRQHRPYRTHPGKES
jgi:tetratricopeptide (TPR) repeat protein